MKKKLWLLGLLLLSIAIFIGGNAPPATALANATCPTIAKWTGTTNITCSYARDELAGEAGIGSTFWFGASGITANTTFINVSANVTVNGTCPVTATTNNTCYLGFTMAASLFEDAVDYQYKFQIFNQTAGQNINSTAVTGIVIDNQAPTAPTALAPGGASRPKGSLSNSSAINFTMSVTNAQTVGCTMALDGATLNGTTTNMTINGNYCAFTIESLPYTCYTWRGYASDGSNSTVSADSNFCFLPPTVGLSGATPEQLGLTQGSGGALVPAGSAPIKGFSLSKETFLKPDNTPTAIGWMAIAGLLMAFIPALRPWKW